MVDIQPISDLLALADMYWSNREREAFVKPPPIQPQAQKTVKISDQQRSTTLPASERDAEFERLQALANSLRGQRSR